MILLWGLAEDGPLDAVRAALARRGAPSFFLDQARAAEAALDWSLDRAFAGHITLADASCDLADVDAVYLRPYSTSETQRLDAALYEMLEVLPARLVNPVAAMATNASKPYQSALIAAQGFAVPDTIVTTDPVEATAFRARHEEVIYKSVSGIRSIVRRFADADADRLDDVAWCPTQFQQYVPGRDYRVHVVGDQVFTAEIVSDADDYRYARRQDEPVDIVASRLPEPLAGACAGLAASLGLPVAGIDLRLTPGGEWYCFEVNPSPAFTYYEAATGLPIADAVAGLLDNPPPTER